VTPKLAQRTALLRKLREVFQRYQSQPVGRVIAVINPILRRWVNYFRTGNAARCLAYVRLWVEKRVRRQLMRARGRRGFGWKRWSTPVDISNPAIRGQAKTGHRASAQAVRVFYRIAT
jgi:RNA-directed DNA polymerase